MQKKRFILQLVIVGLMYLDSSLLFAKEQLVFAIDLIRHGARTPSMPLPNEPYLWKEGPGELTAEGIQEETRLGQRLRQEYVEHYHLLPQQYDNTKIYVRSTRVSRTIQSAEALLSGLYPVDTRPSAYQNIPIETFVKEQDFVLVARSGFHPWSLLKCYLANRKRWNKQTSKIQDKLKNWSETLQVPLNNFYELDKVADNLAIRKAHGIAPPKGLSPKDVEDIIAIYEYGTYHKYRLKAFTQPMSQEFLKLVNHYFELAKRNKTPLKYVLFSAHDSTIMSLLNALGSPVQKMPPFASRINFLLFENNGDYRVKVFYNGDQLLTTVLT